MIRDKKEMLNFEEVDKIETFFGLNKGGDFGTGINRIIMEFKYGSVVTIVGYDEN